MICTTSKEIKTFDQLNLGDWFYDAEILCLKITEDNAVKFLDNQALSIRLQNYTEVIPVAKVLVTASPTVSLEYKLMFEALTYVWNNLPSETELPGTILDKIRDAILAVDPKYPLAKVGE